LEKLFKEALVSSLKVWSWHTNGVIWENQENSVRTANNWAAI